MSLFGWYVTRALFGLIGWCFARRRSCHSSLRLFVSLLLFRLNRPWLIQHELFLRPIGHDRASFVEIPLLAHLSQHSGILGQLLPELNNVIFFFRWLWSWWRLWLRWISLQKVIDSQLLIVNLGTHTLHFIENCSALRSTKLVDFAIGRLLSIF